MKKMVMYLYTMLQKFLYAFEKRVNLSGSLLWDVRITQTKSCEVSLRDTYAKRVAVTMSGMNNVVRAEGAELDNCEIRVSGTANTVSIAPNCNLLNSTIVVHGNHCSVTIGKSTTVGSMYMVCMGQDNSIAIGEDCMIADNVDIWATDAHPVFNEKNEVCNPSKPIVIGNHVWLGKYAKVLKGTTINDNAIVGMNTIVTKEIPAGTLVVGSDGRAVKSNVNWSKEFIRV